MLWRGFLKRSEAKPRSAWNEKIDAWKRDYPLRYIPDMNIIKPQYRD